MRRLAGVAVVVAIGFGAIEAWALTRVVPAKDPSPTTYTRATLVSRTDIVKVRVKVPYPNTKVRFKVYPETYRYAPTSSSCAGMFHTARHLTNDNGVVVIRLNPTKPLCAGVLYQAETLIGTGDVPDKFAHICVRARGSDDQSFCSH